MNENSGENSPVFRDRVDPKRAPSAVRPPKDSRYSHPPVAQQVEAAQQRQAAVIDRYAQRSSDLAPHIHTQPTPGDVSPRIGEAEEVLATAQTEHAAASREDDIAEEGRFAFLRRFNKKRTPTERQQQMSEAQIAIDTAQAASEHATSDLQAAQMYNEDYLRREADPNRIQELIDANKRGGPNIVSWKMTDALRKQDALQKELEPVRAMALFYESHGYDVSQSNFLPYEVYQNLMQDEGKRWGPEFSKEGLEQKALMMTGVNEVALEYADSHNIDLDEKAYALMFGEGRKITDGVGKNKVYQFARRFREHISSGEIGYYAIGASELDELLNWKRIPQGEAQVPYVLAYAAGVLSNDMVMHVATHARDWLADILPEGKMGRTRRYGEWEDAGLRPRGLGSDLEDPRHGYWSVQSQGTTDTRMADVMRKANEIVRSVKGKFDQKNILPSVVRNFNINDVKEPLVR